VRRLDRAGMKRMIQQEVEKIKKVHHLDQKELAPVVAAYNQKDKDVIEAIADLKNTVLFSGISAN